jgi:hypothetical protein
LYVGETVQLKLSGATSVSWSSSNKKVATVTSKGKVKGVKKGTSVITAKNKKTKKSYTCKVTVKALQSFGITADDIYVLTGGTVIVYQGVALEGVTYLLDGKQIPIADDTIFFDQEKFNTQVILAEKLTEGEHTFSIQKKGYTTVTKTFTFEGIKTDGMFARESRVTDDGMLYLFCNPQLQGKTFTVTLDGKTVSPTDSFLNGDGYFMIWVDVSNVSAGTHTVTVTADGIADGTATINI